MRQTSENALLLRYPYRALEPIPCRPESLAAAGESLGSSVVWRMGEVTLLQEADVLSRRPGGLSLIAVLPAGAGRAASPRVVTALHITRPTGVLPHHENLRAEELTQVLRTPPLDLPGDVADYLVWRGFRVDGDTLRLVRRIVDLSGELKSITAVARSLYMSRRALGRRLHSRGLPVPSHWLQMGRLLRIVSRLQNSGASLASLAFEAGYPDGFSVSNQMFRLTGQRPTMARTRLGWEWLLEQWLRREAELGGLSPSKRPPKPSTDTAWARPKATVLGELNHGAADPHRRK